MNSGNGNLKNTRKSSGRWQVLWALCTVVGLSAAAPRAVNAQIEVRIDTTLVYYDTATGEKTLEERHCLSIVSDDDSELRLHPSGLGFGVRWLRAFRFSSFCDTLTQATLVEFRGNEVRRLRARRIGFNLYAFDFQDLAPEVARTFMPTALQYYTLRSRGYQLDFRWSTREEARTTP